MTWNIIIFVWCISAAFLLHHIWNEVEEPADRGNVCLGPEYCNQIFIGNCVDCPYA